VFHVAIVQDQYPETYTGPANRWHSNESRPSDFAHVGFISRDSSQMVRIHLSTRALGEPLAPGVFADAVSIYKEVARKPAFDITLGSNSCGNLTATFWVLEIEWRGAELMRLLAAFDYRCHGLGPVMRGCVGYRPPPDEDAGP
jgi:hypothetical protein